MNHSVMISCCESLHAASQVAIRYLASFELRQQASAQQELGTCGG